MNKLYLSLITISQYVTVLTASTFDDLLVESIQGSFMYGKLMISSIVIMYVFFIFSQNKLIDSLRTEGMDRTNKFWTWSQLFPLWGFIALIIAVIKINNQYRLFLSENYIKYGEVHKHRPIYVWLFLSLSVASIIEPVFVIVGFVFLTIYWINISEVRNNIEKYLIEY